MKFTLLLLCSIMTLSLFAQDEFTGTYERQLDDSTFETIRIEETADCYEGQFIEVTSESTTVIEMAVECFMDGADYFFLVISWDDLEFEISPLQWDDQGQIAAFELLAEFEMVEPLIFYRKY